MPTTIRARTDCSKKEREGSRRPEELILAVGGMHLTAALGGLEASRGPSFWYERL